MKIKLIMILMSFSAVTWANVSLPNPSKTYKRLIQTESKPSTKQTKKLLGAAAPNAILGTNYRQPDSYVIPGGYSEFNYEWTAAEKTQYFDDLIDLYANAHYTLRHRFDRNRPERNLAEAHVKTSEKVLEELLNRCVKLINPEKNDTPLESNIAISKDEYQQGLLSHYLSAQMTECSQYLYTVRYNPEDFEFIFSEKQLDSKEMLKKQLDSKEMLKKQLVENLYVVIYLKTRSAGLLRKMEGAYYPQSLLREHAYRTKLTEFIQKQQALAGTALPHDELAIAYFGSRQAWIDDFNLFLDQKTNKLTL